jgi:hexosaminidase
VDAVHPESDRARQFAGMVDALLAGKAAAGTEAQIRQWLTLWRDNDAKLQPQIAGSFLLQEDSLLSRNLSALGNAGLQAMDYYSQQSQQASDDWVSQQSRLIEEAAKPSAQLLLMVAEPVRKLMAAAGQNKPAK